MFLSGRKIFFLKTLLTSVNPIWGYKLGMHKREREKDGPRGGVAASVSPRYTRIRSNPSARNAMRIKIPFEYLAHILSVIYNA